MLMVCICRISFINTFIVFNRILIIQLDLQVWTMLMENNYILKENNFSFSSNYVLGNFFLSTHKLQENDLFFDVHSA